VEKLPWIYQNSCTAQGIRKAPLGAARPVFSSRSQGRTEAPRRHETQEKKSHGQQTFLAIFIAYQVLPDQHPEDGRPCYNMCASLILLFPRGIHPSRGALAAHALGS